MKISFKFSVSGKSNVIREWKLLSQIWISSPKDMNLPEGKIDKYLIFLFKEKKKTLMQNFRN